MLIHPLVERLRGLGLAAMADTFIEMQHGAAADDLSREDWLGLLVDREVTARENKRLRHRLRNARLRQNAVIEDADLRTPTPPQPDALPQVQIQIIPGYTLSASGNSSASPKRLCRRRTFADSEPRCTYGV